LNYFYVKRIYPLLFISGTYKNYGSSTNPSETQQLFVYEALMVAIVQEFFCKFKVKCFL